MISFEVFPQIKSKNVTISLCLVLVCYWSEAILGKCSQNKHLCHLYNYVSVYTQKLSSLYPCMLFDHLPHGTAEKLDSEVGGSHLYPFLGLF